MDGSGIAQLEIMAFAVHGNWFRSRAGFGDVKYLTYPNIRCYRE